MLDEAVNGFGYDFVPLRTAGQLFKDGNLASLYAQDPNAYNMVADPVFLRASQKVGFSRAPTPFVYPPLIAALMSHVSDLPATSITWVWAVVSAIAFIAGVVLVRRIYLPESSLLALTAVFLALCFFEPALYGFWLGQTSAVIFALVMCAIALQRAGLPLSAGGALAVATFVKITPGIFVLIWLWRGPHRAVAGFLLASMALWLASLVTVPLEIHVAYALRVLAAGGAQIVSFNNHSLATFISRFAFEPNAYLDWLFRTPPPLYAALRTVCVIAVLGAAGITLRMVSTRVPHLARIVAEGLALLLLLLIPNISWTHYFVFALPVIAIVLRLRARGERMPILAVAIAFAFLCRPLLSPQYQPPSLWGAPLSISLPTIATILLFMTLVALAIARSRQRLTPGEPTLSDGQR